MSAPPSSASAGATFYRFENAEGRLEIVDSLAQVPEPLRNKAERVELATAPRAAIAPAVAPHPVPALDWPSFGAGFGAAILLGLCLSLLRGRRSTAKVAASLGLAAAVAGLIGAAYLGLLRRATGQSDSALGTPGAILEDAKKAVGEVERRREQERLLLEEIGREASGRDN